MMSRCLGGITLSIFILLSIKTRIETLRRNPKAFQSLVFLSYYPLKQGLKLEVVINTE